MAKKKSFDLGGNRTHDLRIRSTICVPSATRHTIHMYPYFLFAANHHLKSSRTFSVRLRSSVGRVTVDLIYHVFWGEERRFHQTTITLSIMQGVQIEPMTRASRSLKFDYFAFVCVERETILASGKQGPEIY